MQKKHSEICLKPKDLPSVAKKLIQKYPDSRIFAFYGSMGAGKTTFIKAICSYLGVVDMSSSPSFSIVNEYRLNSSERIYHFDFYRIKNISEVFDIGYEDYFFSGHYCFLEWPEKIEELLPENYVNIEIFVNTNESRTINF